ncbi:MAG: 30S ribosomal protein THX [Flavobacteriales bacterium]|nr:30S ribosomal protein THX [Flavobacteriales bacterium]
MGKGDIKSKKGKITNGSYGVKRKRKSATKAVVKPKAKKEIAAKEVKVEKAPAKKTVAKKTPAKK